MKKVLIVGAGSFGTALAICFEVSPDLDISLHGTREEILNEILKSRTNKRYLSDVVVPSRVNISFSLQEGAKGAELVLMVIPSQAIRGMARKLAPFLDPGARVLCFAKGLELNTHMRLSEVIKEEMPHHSVSIVSGPSHAEEVAKRYPTSVVVASDNMEEAEYIQKSLSNQFFRIYRSQDTVGVEMAGVIKNIIALASGISDGLGYGDNTKALLITRGLVEMSRIGVAVGSSRETFNGLAGLGDLVVTATSRLSRNWNFGYKIGQGKTKEQALKEMSMVVEGITATRATYELSKELSVEMPITEHVYRILYEDMKPSSAVISLMSRVQKEDGFY